jgi:hypothetical protein
VDGDITMIISVTETMSVSALTHDSLLLSRIRGHIYYFGKVSTFYNDLSWMSIEIMWGISPLYANWFVVDDWAGE